MRSFLGILGGRLAPSLVLLAGFTAAGAAPPAVHVLEDRVYFFRAQDGTVLALMALDFLAARDGIAAYAAAAKVEEVDRAGESRPDEPPWTVSLEQAREPARSGTATFHGRAYLRSGRSYAVRYSVTSANDDEIFLKNARVVVPYLGTGFSVSSVVPAESFGPAGGSAGPFQVGSEEVVPKPFGTFKRSELLKLYLQVYDAVVDPETFRRRVDVVFRFYRVAEKSSKRQGKPYSVKNAGGASMGLALPIGDWPTGSYRVAVELRDRRSAGRASTEGSFSIVED